MEKKRIPFRHHRDFLWLIFLATIANNKRLQDHCKLFFRSIVYFVGSLEPHFDRRNASFIYTSADGYYYFEFISRAFTNRFKYLSMIYDTFGWIWHTRIHWKYSILTIYKKSFLSRLKVNILKIVINK